MCLTLCSHFISILTGHIYCGSVFLLFWYSVDAAALTMNHLKMDETHGSCAITLPNAQNEVHINGPIHVTMHGHEGTHLYSLCIHTFTLKDLQTEVVGLTARLPVEEFVFVHVKVGLSLRYEGVYENHAGLLGWST